MFNTSIFIFIMCKSFPSFFLVLYKQMAERCNCNKWVVIRTTWTEKNSGQRFAGCPDYGCNYFRWVDAPLCERARIIIPGLIRRINMLEGEIKVLEEKNVKKSSCNKSMLVLFVTMFIICMFLCPKKLNKTCHGKNVMHLSILYLKMHL